jgi:hypothetical protein
VPSFGSGGFGFRFRLWFGLWLRHGFRLRLWFGHGRWFGFWFGLGFRFWHRFRFGLWFRYGLWLGFWLGFRLRLRFRLWFRHGFRLRLGLWSGNLGGRLLVLELGEGIFLAFVRVDFNFFNRHLALVIGFEHKAFGHSEAEVLLVGARECAEAAELVFAGTANLVGKCVYVVEPHLFGDVFADAFAFGDYGNDAHIASGLAAIGYGAAGRVEGASGRVVVRVVFDAVKRSDARDFYFLSLFQLFDD